MAGFKQSSILFTLENLKGAEREWGTVPAEQERLLSQVNRARAARERRRREQADQEKRAVAEEQARFEAMKQAEIARARTEAAARAKLEVLARQHEHEQRLAAIDAEGRSRRARLLSRLSLVVMAVVTATTLGIYVLKVRPETQRIQTAYDRLVAAERKRADDVEQLLAQERARRERLAHRLAQTESELAAQKKRVPH